MSESGVNSFLKKSGRGDPGAGKVTVVMGNEAADLDSMASAVLYAYFLSITEAGSSPVPLVNIPRGDFKLRTEAVFLFKEAGIDVDAMTFAGDVDLKVLAAEGRLSLILIDHNKLASGQSDLESSVTAILDHHADEKAYPSTAKTDIRPVGSAATIVAESFLKDAADAVDASVGTLLLGTILLDTVNLDPEAERVTDADRVVAEKLSSITGSDRDALFEKLQFEKFNVASLDSYDLLRKDYKEWQMGPVKCGIGSVLMSAEAWMKNDPEIASSFDKYLKERNLDVLLAMNAFTEPSFTRHLGVYVPDFGRRQKLIEFLEASDLRLEALGSGLGADRVAFYNQKNLGTSRKKLQPILLDYFTG